ncbi:ATP synthase F1 subunit gamma [Mycoplasmopsis ciconiae]|uniref:ATP synthase gamma chain n=1 Tax=Mycoplasmopsis ciconiae TaxID=561067 RepID=A0ABU7MKX0_9BACT|nr:ATP synthase F1 subunit gamma [Mycoplasmopsis ciconiae]
MSNLNALKNRINVVNSTKKITHAMELVATSKLRKYKQEYLNVQEYQNYLEDTIKKLMSHLKDNELKTIFPKWTNSSDLYVVITSDLGLCGSYNSNIFNILKNNLKNQDKVIVLGLKGVGFFRNSNFKELVINEIPNYGDRLEYQTASVVSTRALDLLLTNKVKSINLVYTEFVNNVTQEARIKRLLPFESNQKNDKNLNKNNASAVLQIEPNAQSVLKSVVPLYLSSMIYTLGASSKVSEMASRRNAMESATDNASELNHKLKLDYNRTRQGLITQEITEIVSGADAT